MRRSACGRPGGVPRAERLRSPRGRVDRRRRGGPRRGSGDECTCLSHTRSRPRARTARVPGWCHDRRKLRGRGARGGIRRLSGLRARADLALPACRPAGPVRQRLPRGRRGCERLARLGRGVRPALRLARCRCDARDAVHGATRQAGRGTRLRRRGGAARHLPGRRARGARGGGDVRDARRARAGATTARRRRAHRAAGRDPEPRRDAAISARRGDDAGDGRENREALGRRAAAAPSAATAGGRASEPAAAAAAAADREGAG